MAIAPTVEQWAWQKKELGVFCHFGINTFYGKEWSDGTLSPDGFNPVEFDARQWVRLAKECGAGYMIMTAKHHDGFCLWPTDTTDYSVKSSPWKDGKGDAVGEFVAACAAEGMPAGLYLSPWDRHEKCYHDKEAYDDFYVRQLTELCTRYGRLYELWFDGAGSEGREYDWNAIMNVAEKHQPQAMIFNLGRPTIRWVGNEDGLASDPCYYETDRVVMSAFTDDEEKSKMRYLPPECDVPIRGNWFWQPDDLQTLKSLEHLLGIWYRSVGYGANLLLNVGPDRRGLVSDEDAARLRELKHELDRRFARPLHSRLAHEGDVWRADFGANTRMDHLVLVEDYSGGQFADGYTIICDDREICRGRTIGNKKIHPFPVIECCCMEIRIENPDAVLQSVTGYMAGSETMPELGDKFDYERWEKKANKKM